MKTINRKPLATAIVLGACLLVPLTTLGAAPAIVTSDADTGAGSLREALEAGATLIRINPAVGAITIDSTLTYAGTEPLRIYGNSTAINASGDFTVLELSNGASIRANQLTLNGPGGFSFANQGSGKGLFIRVPGERTGIVNVELIDVTVSGVANHGIHVSDCTLGDECGAGSGGGGDGSPASINVVVRGVTVDDAGNGKFDADGIRVDERADGGITFQATDSVFRNVGADGVELDEGNDGDVHIEVWRSDFMDNGGYCLPSPLVLEQPCVEDDDGDLVLDLDDGFDIDEAGPGNLTGSVTVATVANNLDEGLDFDEEGEGKMDMDFVRIDGYSNGDEAIKMSSVGPGDVYAEIMNSVIMNNGNDGTEFETEDGDGQVHIRIGNTTFEGNDSEDVAAAQENEVDLGTLRVRASTIGEVDLENVQEI